MFIFDQDCHGHGTHCAGIAAGTNYGVAKQAIVHGIRVLNCEGSGSAGSVIGGIYFLIILYSNMNTLSEIRVQKGSSLVPYIERLLWFSKITSEVKRHSGRPRLVLYTCRIFQGSSKGS